MGGKIFPHFGLSGGVDPRIVNRGGVYAHGDDKITKSVESHSFDDIIKKAKQLNEVNNEVSKIARAIRKNERKSKKEKAEEGRLRIVKNDVEAQTEGPNVRKNFHLQDLKEIQPLTERQKETFIEWNEEQNLILTGSAGTGKTFLAVYLALRDLLDADFPQKKIVIVRSVVPVRDMGFLPGDMEEKSAVYEQPYVSIFNELFPYKNSYENMKKVGLVEFATTSFLRGITYNDAIIIVDEVENMTFQEISTIITRVGKNTRIVFAGDLLQSDLVYKKNDVSGMKDFQEMAQAYMKSMSVIRFDRSDIVRSGLVKEFIIAREKAGL